MRGEREVEETQAVGLGPRSRPGQTLGARRVARWLGGAVARGLPRGLLVAAALLALADGFAFGWTSLASLLQLLPVDAPTPNGLVAAVTALALTALVVGLWRDKRLAWWLALLAFLAGSLAELLALGHPVGGLLAAACAALLVLDRRRYGVRSSRVWGWRAWLLIALGGAGVTAETALVLLSARSGLAAPIDLLSASDLLRLAATLAGWLAFGDPAAAAWRAGGPLAVALAVLARLLVLVAVLGILRPAEDDPADPASAVRVARLAERYGSGALLPFQVAADKRWFCPPGLDAFVAYGRDGRTAVVVGEPVGAAVDRWPAFAAFVATCRQRDWIPVGYQASDAALDELRRIGFGCSMVGREAIVDLADFSLEGARRANLRHTVTRARRGGVRMAWFGRGLAGEDAAALVASMADVDRAWRRRAGPEMHFTINRFEPADLHRTAVSIALDEQGSVIAFATFRPTGVDRGWVLDLMRRVPGGTPGALEACVAEAAVRLGESGAATLSLGLAPLSGLDPAGDRMEERALAAIGRFVRPLYDVEGLAFFKNKFGPRWEARYVAVPGRIHLPGLVLALARLHLGARRWALVRSARSVPGALVPRLRAAAKMPREAPVGRS